MKRIVFLSILIFITGLIVSCSDSSGGDSDTGYVDPGNWGGITVVNKAYSLGGIGWTCGPSSSCLAVIYQGKLNGTQYVGIGIKNGSNTQKIYWPGSTIQTGTFSCTARLNSNVATTETITITAVTANGDGTYTLTFGVTGVTINPGSTMTAIKV